ncbi:MAG TPA: hypothetical protein VGP42_08695 [Stellaceae bacterium]|jgi:hypothetical protein|nr:hypothetical protein [Stellaceae bacterium]
MPVRRRHDKRRIELPDDAIEWLYDGHGSPWIYRQTVAELGAVWREHEEVIVAEHASQWPGTRPARWWHSPRQSRGADSAASAPRRTKSSPTSRSFGMAFRDREPP